LCHKLNDFANSPIEHGDIMKEVSGMTVRSFGATVAAVVLASTLSVGCSSTAEKSANRAEDAAKRAEAAAGRVEAAAQRAEAAAEKVERLLDKGMRK
jgi:hypothetical protein